MSIGGFMKGGIASSVIAGAMMLAAPALAQDYPTRPIQLIVPFAAGGPSDISARAIAESLGDQLGQPVVVENRPGAGANVGMQALLAAAPDGYTVMMGSNVITTAKFLYSNITWDVENDVRPVIGVTMSPVMALVPAASPANTLEEFIELARTGDLVYGSAGAGTVPQIATEMFKQRAEIDLLHIPYRGAGQALPALVAEEVDIFFDIVFSAQGQIRAGTIKPLAVTSLERVPQFPDVPTLHEEGLENFEAISWFGIITRADVPDEIVARLNEALNTVLESDSFIELAERIGSTPIGGTPEDFQAMIDSDIATWGEVISTAGIVVDQ